MNTHCYMLYEKARTDNPYLDQSGDASEAQRSQITSAEQSAHDEKATSPMSTENVNVSKAIGTAHNGLSEIADYHVGKRLLRVAILAICYSVLELIVKTVTVAQFIFVAWKKRPHPGMQRLGTMIAEYMHTMWRYCTFASDDSPWPFRR